MRKAIPLEDYWCSFTIRSEYTAKIYKVAEASNNPKVVDKVIELANECRKIEEKIGIEMGVHSWATYLELLQTKRLSL